jgi:hypothetical protein
MDSQASFFTLFCPLGNGLKLDRMLCILSSASARSDVWLVPTMAMVNGDTQGIYIDAKTACEAGYLDSQSCWSATAE